MFGIKYTKTADGKTQADMNVCLQSPQVGVGAAVTFLTFLLVQL